MGILSNLNEKDIEDILAKHHDYFIEKGLTLDGRQVTFHRKRADLIFTDRFGDTLIVEIKKGVIKRKHVAQIMDYLGEMVDQTENRVRIMLIGKRVPPSWKLALDQHGIEYRGITLKDYSLFLSRNDKTLYEQIQHKKTFTQETESVVEDRSVGSSHVWSKIHSFALRQVGKETPILNPEYSSPFVISEVTDDYIQIDKLSIKLTREMFEDTHEFLMNGDTWIRIGASRVNTRPGTLEEYLKLNYFGGKKNSLSTATWVAAILVHSCNSIEFNEKSRDQAIRYTPKEPKKKDLSNHYSKYPWSRSLEKIGNRFKDFYPYCNMSQLPSAGSNVKIHTDIENIHFEWWIRGPTSNKIIEVGLHIEKQGDEPWNQKILDHLKKHKAEFEEIIDEPVIYSSHVSGRKRFKDYKRISVEKEFNKIDEETFNWAIDKMKKFYKFYNPILSKLDVI